MRVFSWQTELRRRDIQQSREFRAIFLAPVIAPIAALVMLVLAEGLPSLPGLLILTLPLGVMGYVIAVVICAILGRLIATSKFRAALWPYLVAGLTAGGIVGLLVERESFSILAIGAFLGGLVALAYWWLAFSSSNQG